ncbi:MAG: DUF1003 domain-containing protein [Candidatus Nanopelagicales bacterium]
MSKRNRLDTPVTQRGIKSTYDSETFGVMSERIARFIGSWRFIAYMSAFIVAWIVWNLLSPEGLTPDEYPFIFLTFLLSLQASYAAPLILLAQNRQTDRDRVTISEDRMRTERLFAEMEFLSREIAAIRIALGDLATREFVRSELEDAVEDLKKPDTEQDSK